MGAVAAMFACSSNLEDGGQLRRGLGYSPTGSSTGDAPLTGDQGDDLEPGGQPPTSVSPDGGAGPDVFDAGDDAVPTSIQSTGLAMNCKLISGDDEDHDGPSGVQAQANLKKSEFGIPVANGDNLFFLFGDSAGVKNIWKWGPESLPDAVGYSGVGLASVASNPRALCSSLRILKANSTDFAGAAMGAPSGQSLSDYIHNPAGPRGENTFPQLPGDSEVPTGAFAYNGNVYIYYTTVDSSSNPVMKASYVARWSAPTTSSAPNYAILHKVDAAGSLRGDFINVAPLVYGDFLYLFGTGVPNGKLRQSQVRLVRKRIADVETEGGYTRFDPSSNSWVAANASTGGVVGTDTVGELSVQYYDEIKKFVMLTQEYTFLHARFADKPEGPWSAPVEIANMSDSSFRSRYCCSGTTCPGEKAYFCDTGGLYAPYLLPKLRKGSGGAFDLSFTISTWRPYNVAWMTASFTL